MTNLCAASHANFLLCQCACSSQLKESGSRRRKSLIVWTKRDALFGAWMVVLLTEEIMAKHKIRSISLHGSEKVKKKSVQWKWRTEWSYTSAHTHEKAGSQITQGPDTVTCARLSHERWEGYQRDAITEMCHLVSATSGPHRSNGEESKLTISNENECVCFVSVFQNSKCVLFDWHATSRHGTVLQ